MAKVNWIISADASDPWDGERGCQYGDGLFETIAIVDGQPCLWDYHLQRLQLGCKRLRLPLCDPKQLKAHCDRACHGHASAVLKLYWTAGRSARGYRRPEPLQPSCVMTLSPWTPPVVGSSWQLTRCAHRLGDNPALAGIKHLNRLDQVLGRNEWTGSEFDEGLMQGQDGRPVCGTMSNLFIERGGKLSTPAVDSAGVAGVTRQCLLDVAAHNGVPISTRDLTEEDLAVADAMYMTNALAGIRRVARCGDLRFDLNRPELQVIDAARALVHDPYGGRSDG